MKRSQKVEEIVKRPVKRLVNGPKRPVKRPILAGLWLVYRVSRQYLCIVAKKIFFY
jgi:hypothetical protein